MARKPKTDRVPRTRAGGEWTEASFWAFVRSGLRQLSRRWPPLARIAVNSVRRPYVGENKRQKWEYQCQVCKGWRMRKEIEVDHIDPCGSLKSIQDVGPFVERLFAEPDKLRVLCESCHQQRTNATTEEKE